MTNNELAAQCLIEAAELLSESSGANGVHRRYMALKKLESNEKRRQSLQDDLKHATSQRAIDNIKSALEYLDYDDKALKKLYNAKGNISNYKLFNMPGMSEEEKQAIIYDDRETVRSRRTEDVGYKNLAKTIRSSNVNRKINERARKSDKDNNK